MIAVNYSSLRNNMKDYLNLVTEECETLLINRSRADTNVLVVSEESYENLQEVLHLLESFSNHQWLQQSEEQLANGQVHIMQDMQKPVIFSENAWQDYARWESEDKRILRKLDSFLGDITGGSNAASGRSRPLQGELRGCWSRRLNEKDRLVYRMDAENVYVLACRYHDR